MLGPRAIGTIYQWRQDSRDLNEIIKARQISSKAALNVLTVIMAARNRSAQLKKERR